MSLTPTNNIEILEGGDYMPSQTPLSYNYNSTDNTHIRMFNGVVITIDALYRIFTFWGIVQGITLVTIENSTVIMVGIFTIAMSVICALMGLEQLPVIKHLNLSKYFLFLMTCIGRSMIIMFIAFLVRYTSNDNGWDKFVFVYNIIMSCSYFIVGVVTKYILMSDTDPTLWFPTNEYITYPEC